MRSCVPKDLVGNKTTHRVLFNVFRNLEMLRSAHTKFESEHLLYVVHEDADMVWLGLLLLDNQHPQIAPNTASYEPQACSCPTPPCPWLGLLAPMYVLSARFCHHHNASCTIAEPLYFGRLIHRQSPGSFRPLTVVLTLTRCQSCWGTPSIPRTASCSTTLCGWCGRFAVGGGQRGGIGPL